MKKSSLLIKEPPLVVLPSLASAIGLNEAIIVQQLHYWLDNPHAGVERDGAKWIFNTYEQWQENFPFWSVSTIQRIFSNLEKLGLIISAQLDAKKHDQTKFYRLDYDALCKLEDVNLTSSKTPTCNDVNKNTETTSETTKDKEQERAPLSEKAMKQANQQVTDMIEIEKQGRASWQGREKMPPAVRDLADEFVVLTGIKPAKKELTWWMGEFSDWLGFGVQKRDIKAGIDYAKDHNYGIMSPASLTKTVRMLAAKKHAPQVEQNVIY